MGIDEGMPTILQDSDFLNCGIRELEDYLVSSELFWQLSGGGNLPRLTLGGLLLARKRLQARENLLPAGLDLAQMDRQLTAAQVRWRAAWEKKAVQEARSRFELWKNYLDDYHQSPDLHAGEYPRQVQYRVMLHLLEIELPGRPDALAALAGLDEFLKTSFLGGPFIWEPDLAPVFPASDFWYLFGRLKL